MRRQCFVRTTLDIRKMPKLQILMYHDRIHAVQMKLNRVKNDIEAAYPIASTSSYS